MPERSLLAAMGVAFWCLIGCGGNEFSSSPSGASGSGAGGDQGGQGGSEQGGESGGLAGATTTAGSATGGRAGSGGSGPVGCDCPVGNYCRDGSTDCLECRDMNRLRFRPPEKLTSVSGGAASRSPRAGATSNDLLYEVEGVGLRYTTDSSASAGNGVAQTTPEDHAPLLLSDPIGASPNAMIPSFNFAFDRLVVGNRRAIFIGQWDGGLTSSEEAPEPFNADGSSNFGLAIAVQGAPGGAARAYWITNRTPGGSLALVTTLSTLEPPVPVLLHVGDPTCDALAEDLTPWVTPNGTTLLFSHTRMGPGMPCAPQAPANKDLYTALMAPATGQPVNSATAAASPLADVNSPANDVDPSFSADACDLYFASDRDGELAVYRAHRR